MDKREEFSPKVDGYVRELCQKIGVGIDAGLLEEVVSLFNAKVLTAYICPLNTDFNMQNCQLKVSQCYRVGFTGKERIIELETKLSQAQETIADFRSALERINHQTLNAVIRVESGLPNGLDATVLDNIVRDTLLKHPDSTEVKG